MPDRSTRVSASALLVLGIIAGSVPCAAPARASEPVRLGVGGGLVRSKGDFSWVWATGYTAHSFVAARLPFAPIAPRIEVRYARQPNGARGHVPEAPSVDRRSIRSAALEIELDPLPDARFSPYVVGGLGVARVAVALYFLPDEPFYDRANATVLCGGAGARWRLGCVSAYAEAQYQRLRVGSRDPGFETGIDDAPFVPISLGVMIGGRAR